MYILILNRNVSISWELSTRFWCFSVVMPSCVAFYDNFPGRIEVTDTHTDRPTDKFSFFYIYYTAEQKYALEYQITDLSIIKQINVHKLSLIAGRSTSFSDTLHNSSWYGINKLSC